MAVDQRTISAQRRIASDISWARTPNRSERTAPARAASPNSLEFWVKKITDEGVVRPEDIQANAASAYRAHMRAKSLKAVAARKASAADREAQRLQRFQRSA